jgi:tetratricopeptide (TPR) repeat protein
VLSGPAGVGKTALAVYWAHRVGGRFPDGQLYVNLRGFEPAADPRAPADAVLVLLDALGVPPDRIPADFDARIGRYRSLMAGRRMLVLLDNARDAAQVRPLLPGTSSAFVVVTSRDPLTGLVAGEAARSVPVGLLDPAGARALLAGRLGEDRVAAEPAAVDEIVARCAGLPLALAVVAARAAAGPPSLAALAAELRAADGLDPLTGTDAATDVRAVFASSYRLLSPAAARLFRLLAGYPAAEFGEPAAASLAGGPVGPQLAELVRACLVMVHGPNRYTRHDLLLVYAREVAGADPDDEVAAARRRMLDHLLHTAYAADRRVIPSRFALPLDAPGPGAVVVPPADRPAALAWFAAERPALVAAVGVAAGAGLDRHAWQLAWVALEYLNRWGHGADAAAAHEVALAAARRLADPAALAFTHRGLGRAYGLLGRLDEAEHHLERSAELFTALGSPAGAARTQLSLAGLAERRGRYRVALRHAARALDLFRRSGEAIGTGNALNTVAWYHSLLGDHVTALARNREALSILESTGDGYGLAATWAGLGVARHGLGSFAEAVSCYQRALELYRANADRFGEAETLHRLGEAYTALGDPAAAREAREQAARIHAELDAA